MSGLSISDLELIYYQNEGIPVGQFPIIPSPSAVDDLSTAVTYPTNFSTATFVDPSATHDLYAPSVNGANFLYRGAGDFEFGASFPDTLMLKSKSKFPNTYTNGQSIWGVEFMTDAAEFKIYFKYLTASDAIRYSINGKRLMDLPVDSDGVTLGSRHLTSITFPDNKIKRIKLEFASIPFGGIWVPKNSQLWKPQSYKQRVMIIGDSISGGSNQNTGSSLGTWFARIAEMLNWDDPWNQAIGGTGYVNDNGTAGSEIPARIQNDLIKYNPNRVIFFAGYNDNAASIEALTNAIRSSFNAVKSSLPTAKVLVVGCWSPNNPAAASHITVDNTIRDMANEFNFIFTSPITGETYKAGKLLLDEPAWITGTGNTGVPTGTGNADRYIGTDDVHPNNDGHKYICDRLYRIILATGF